MIKIIRTCCKDILLQRYIMVSKKAAKAILTIFFVIIRSKDAVSYIVMQNQVPDNTTNDSNITSKVIEPVTNRVISEKLKPKKNALNQFPRNPVNAMEFADYPITSKAYSIILEFLGAVLFLIVTGLVVLATRNKYKLSEWLNARRGNPNDPRPEWTFHKPRVPTNYTAGWTKDIQGPSILYVNSHTIRLVPLRKDTISITSAVYNMGMSSGKHVFACMWPRDQKYARKGHLSIGVGHPCVDTYVELSDYLLGSTKKSLGFDLLKNSIYFDGKKVETYPRGKSQGYNLPTLFYMYVDMDQGKLLFASESEFWGVALNFGALCTPGSSLLYPMVACRGVEGKFMIFYKGEVFTTLNEMEDIISLRSVVVSPKKHYHYDILERIKQDLQQGKESSQQLGSLSSTTSQEEKIQTSSQYHNPAFDFSYNCESSTSSAERHSRKGSEYTTDSTRKKYFMDMNSQQSWNKKRSYQVLQEGVDLAVISSHKDVYKSSLLVENMSRTTNFTNSEPTSQQPKDVAVELSGLHNKGFVDGDEEDEYFSCHL